MPSAPLPRTVSARAAPLSKRRAATARPLHRAWRDRADGDDRARRASAVPAADYVSYALALIEIAAADGATVHHRLDPEFDHGLRPAQGRLRVRQREPVASGADLGPGDRRLCADRGGRRIRRRGDPHAVRPALIGGWRIDGTKQFITSGAIACRDHGDRRHRSRCGPKRHLGAFSCPPVRPGYVVDQVEHKLGQAGVRHLRLRFENCIVPARTRCWVEEVEAAMPRPVQSGGRPDRHRRAIRRNGAGRPRYRYRLCARPAIASASRSSSIRRSASALADLATRLEASRQLVLHAAALKDAGRAGTEGRLDGQAVCVGSGRGDRLRRHPDAGRLWLSRRFGLGARSTAMSVSARSTRAPSDIQRMVIARGCEHHND